MIALFPRRARTRFAAFGSIFLTVLALVIGAGVQPASANSGTAASDTSVSTTGVASDIVKTADLSKFRPGMIISDAVFFNSSAMSEQQIDSFLRQKVAHCQSGYTCLRDFRQATASRSADNYCGAYSGEASESAARIVAKVARACGINPQVLLVMLEKEQGLVSHTWPSAWRYTIAMGQGCPDTAACDTRYYGFYNQMYGAARQMKIYTENRYFTYYAPGRTWNIRWSPNAACGSSPVFIENQATANLYYYTPYQPNAAALRAGYGEGDGCSAYGNRNFYQRFTDWFGSTQAPSNRLLSVGSAIYVVSDGAASHILPADWPTYRDTFGAPVAVDAAYLKLMADGGTASRFLVNASDGTVAYLDGKSTHRFSSCALVTRWGGSCAALVRFAGADFAKIAKGAEMTPFARLTGSTQVHVMDGATLVPVYDAEAAAVLNGGTAPYVAMLADVAASAFARGKVTRFSAGRFITVTGSTRVLLPGWDGGLVYLPSWALATELGFSSTGLRPVATSSVSGFKDGGTLSQFVRCNGQTYFGAGGLLHPVSAGGADGFVVTALGNETCGVLKVASESDVHVFVKASGSPDVYLARAGTFHHITSADQLAALGGGMFPRILTISAAAFARLPLGEPAALTSGELVKSSTDSTVYIVDANRLVHLPTFAMADAMGIRKTVRVDDTFVSALGGKAPVLTHFVRCGSLLYSAGTGQLAKVLSGDPAGNAVTTLASSTCATMNLAGTPIMGRVFLTDGKTTAIADAAGFRRPIDAATAQALNGGTAPMPQVVPAGYFGTLPVPAG